jgi:hypothetical protein
VSAKQSAVDALAVQCSTLGYKIEREHLFAKEAMGRRWRFDIAFPDIKVACEVDGGVFIQGRHSRGAGIEADCQKYGAALQLGWIVVRSTPRLVKSGEALRWIEAAIKIQRVRMTGEKEGAA